MIGGTLKAEIIRTADMVEQKKEEQDIYFIIAFLYDAGYTSDPKRYKMLMEELYDRLRTKKA